MQNLYIKYRNMILYLLIGGTGASLDFLIFSSLSWFFESKLYIVYHLLGYFSGTTVSFVLNAKYNFKKFNRLSKRIRSFYLIALLGLIFSTVFLFILITVFEINQIFSKFLSIFFVFLIQFTLNRKITFS